MRRALADGDVGAEGGGRDRETETGGDRWPVPALDRGVRIALWVLLGAFALQGVFGHSLWGGNDSREGGMIWDMYRHGTWVTPTINGQPFLEKPPLLHWTALVILHAAGRVSEGLVRLPAALFGLGTLVLVYLLVAGPRAPGEPHGEGAGRQLAAWAAVFTCGTAIEFHEYSRIVLTDIALTFVVTLSLFLFWRAWLRPSLGRWVAFLAAAAGAFYGKGLIGPALIWASVAVFLIWRRHFRLLAGLAAAYLPFLIGLVAPWVVALYRAYGAAAVRFAFWDNQIGRFFRFGDRSLPHDPFFINKEPIYYYATHLPVYLLPWTLLLLPALVAWWRGSTPVRSPLHGFVTSALAGMLLVLHLSSAKVVNYALPVYPFIFIVLGSWLADLAQRMRPGVLERWVARLTAWAVVGLFAGVPAAFVAGTFLRPDLFRTGGRATTIGEAMLGALLLALVVTAAVALHRLAGSALRPAALTLAPAAFALVAMATLQLVTPAVDRDRSYRPFAALAAGEAAQGRDVALATSQECDVGAFTFYLDRRLPILRDGSEVASFLEVARPREVIVPTDKLHAIEAALGSFPHAQLQVGAPGTVSRSFVLLLNRPLEEEARAGGSATGVHPTMASAAPAAGPSPPSPAAAIAAVKPAAGLPAVAIPR